MDVFAFVGNKPYQPVDVDVPLDRMVAEYLLELSLFLSEPIDVKDKDLGPIDHGCHLYALLGTTLLAFIVLIKGLFLTKLEVLFCTIGIDVVKLVIFELPVDFTIFTAYLYDIFAQESFVKRFYTDTSLLELHLEAFE